ncbi:unnamed protein product, partial [Polarella glacialis]
REDRRDDRRDDERERDRFGEAAGDGRERLTLRPAEELSPPAPAAEEEAPAAEEKPRERRRRGFDLEPPPGPGISPAADVPMTTPKSAPPVPPGVQPAPPDLPDWLSDIFGGAGGVSTANMDAMLAELRPKGPYREVHIPQRLVARLIGKGGEVIMSMCNASGADIKVRQETKHLGYSLAIITGQEKNMQAAEDLVKARLGIVGDNAGTRELSVAPEHVSSIIGPKGATITEMRLKCNNLNIEIRPGDTPSAPHRAIMGPGSPEQLKLAEELINSKIAKNAMEMASRRGGQQTSSVVAGIQPVSAGATAPVGPAANGMTGPGVQAWEQQQPWEQPQVFIQPEVPEIRSPFLAQQDAMPNVFFGAQEVHDFILPETNECGAFVLGYCAMGSACPLQHGTELPAAFQGVMRARELAARPAQGVGSILRSLAAAGAAHTAAVAEWGASGVGGGGYDWAAGAGGEQGGDWGGTTVASSVAAAMPGLPTPAVAKVPQVCKLFDMGGCHRGDHCHFCHGPAELEAVQQQALFGSAGGISFTSPASEDYGHFPSVFTANNAGY